MENERTYIEGGDGSIRQRHSLTHSQSLTHSHSHSQSLTHSHSQSLTERQLEIFHRWFVRSLVRSLVRSFVAVAQYDHSCVCSSLFIRRRSSLLIRRCRLCCLLVASRQSLPAQSPSPSTMHGHNVNETQILVQLELEFESTVRAIHRFDATRRRAHCSCCGGGAPRCVCVCGRNSRAGKRTMGGIASRQNCSRVCCLFAWCNLPGVWMPTLFGDGCCVPTCGRRSTSKVGGELPCTYTVDFVRVTPVRWAARTSLCVGTLGNCPSTHPTCSTSPKTTYAAAVGRAGAPRNFFNPRDRPVQPASTSDNHAHLPWHHTPLFRQSRN